MTGQIRQVAARALDRLLVNAGVAEVCSRRTAESPRVLAFHGIDHPQNFNRLVEIIATEWHPVSLDDVIGWLGGASIPPRSVLVTFDDGNPSIRDHAIPTLKHHNVPAVAFMIAALIGTTNRPWWDLVSELEPDTADATIRRLKRIPDVERRNYVQELMRRRGPAQAGRQLDARHLTELQDAGIEIGNHTLTHPIIPTCPDCVVHEEIEEAHHLLGAMLGHAPRAFAYPNGDGDSRVSPILARLGYQAAFLFDHGLARNGCGRFQVSRLRVESGTPEVRFRTILSGIHPWITSFRESVSLP